MWTQLSSYIIYLGMPVVMAYHLLTENIFLNTAAQDAEGFEKVANLILSPVQFLLCGKVAILENGEYRLEQRFDYHHHLALKATFSLATVPVSLPMGIIIKGVSHLSSAAQKRHELIARATSSTKVNSNLTLYQKLGIPISSSFDSIDPPLYRRRPGEENALVHEKELLKEIVTLFQENQIPYWVDCGTCLGAFRYGGVIPWDGDVDLAVLSPDFQNVMNVLNRLDRAKYHVQDWSNRCLPQTYIRVYIKENRNHIDIYNFAIDPVKQTLTYILSYEDSSFMIESWKIRERRFKHPSSYQTVFPLRKAQLDGIEVCVPNNTKRYLQERYGENIGPVKIYNEKTDTYEKDLSHPYWKLPYVY